LWLTRDIVEKNGGRLRFRSRTDAPSGTVFTMYLPAEPGHSGDRGEIEVRKGEQISTGRLRA
jgi:hypothetical protein